MDLFQSAIEALEIDNLNLKKQRSINEKLISRCFDYQSIFSDSICKLKTGFNVCISAMNGTGKSNLLAISSFYKHSLYINLESNSASDCAVMLNSRPTKDGIPLLDYWDSNILSQKGIINKNNDFLIAEFRKEIVKFCEQNNRIKVIIIDSIAEVFERYSLSRTVDDNNAEWKEKKGKIELSNATLWMEMSKYMKGELINELNMLTTDLNSMGVSIVWSCPLQEVEEKDTVDGMQKLVTKIDYQTQWKACKEYIKKYLNGVYALNKIDDSKDVYDGNPCIKDQCIYSPFEMSYKDFLTSRELSIAKDFCQEEIKVKKMSYGKETITREVVDRVKTRTIKCTEKEIYSGIIRIGIFQMLLNRANLAGLIDINALKEKHMKQKSENA